MVKKTPAELHQDRARLKLRLDDAARLEYAREQGELLGRVKLLQELLGVEMPTAEELAEFDLQQLTQLAQRLHEQLRYHPH